MERIESEFIFQSSFKNFCKKDSLLKQKFRHYVRYIDNNFNSYNNDLKDLFIKNLQMIGDHSIQI